MATVYEVEDLSTQRRLALKQLQQFDDSRKQKKTRELFEREFYTLSQLAHPRIVEVFDYGVGDSGPYYTMGLLDGGDLQQWAPLPWLRACDLARDICSALSLVHSRRLVYRDLNPRNVRCTNDGVAKLIDFGALADMGPTKHIIGTPAYCAPEAIDLQPIDARTDLYSLGATLYFILTGRHAYPAKSFDELRSLLQSGRPQRLAKLVDAVPPALNALVSELMQLDAALRPANAAEIVEQLAVIAGRTFVELPQVTQAYLSTPTLVGRSAPLARIRTKIARLPTGRVGSVLIDGPSGVGRSRMLTACLLEAKLSGAVALRADASDSREDYAVWAALCAQLLQTDAELTLRAAAAADRGWLVHALPRLASDAAAERTVEQDPNRLRVAVINALRDWVLAIAKQRPLVVAVDDLHAIDEPSLAALALLSHETGAHTFMIIGTAESGAVALAPSALKLFAEGSMQVRLENWAPVHTEKLLRSVFGDVPHVQALAHKLHAITSGNPRDLMQLSQYLVDKQLAFYRAGSWALPAAIDASDLPSSMANAHAARVQGLGTGARHLALGLSLSPDRGISFDECAMLCPHRTAASD